MNILNIKLDYSDLEIGQTRKGECPDCGQNKFYVTRKPEGLAYICFRATCPLEPGFIGDRSAGHHKTLPCKYHRPSWNHPLYLPEVSDYEYFYDRFGINLYVDNGFWCKVTHDDRYAFPIRGQSDEERGIVIRQPSWDGYPSAPRRGVDGAPKSQTFLEPDAIRGAWYQGGSKTVVIVEDQLSAMRVQALGLTAYALLGTWFSDEHLHDLMTFKPDNVVLALDPDAWDKALKISQKHGSAFKRWAVVKLHQDPKDYQTDSELMGDIT